MRLTEDTLAVDLVDGRTIIVPLVWYPRFDSQCGAADELESRWCRIWNSLADLEEDLSPEGLLRGARLRSPNLLNCGGHPGIKSQFLGYEV